MPIKLTENLAEFIGIMMGDGHLSYYSGYWNGRKYVQYEIHITGNASETGYIRHIMNLFLSLFGVNLHYKKDEKCNAATLRKSSKGILQFLNKLCEIPLNNKNMIARIPRIIKCSDNNIKYAFLRGLADTDFCLMFQNKTGKGYCYPVIKGSFKG